MVSNCLRKLIAKLEETGPVKQTGNTLVVPGVSLPKLQLQSMVDFILSVGISHM